MIISWCCGRGHPEIVGGEGEGINISIKTRV